jgi:DNA-directed RNA polymerase subunit alpha
LEEDADLRVELLIGHGRGYIPAEENKEPDQPLGTISMDSIFSPIRKVNYATENTRVGQRTDYEKLTIETWTNGAVRPDEALASAAQLLVDHLRLFYSGEEEPEIEEEEEVDQEAERIGELLRMSVEELELSVRSSNCLRAAGIKALADLVQKTEQEMLKYRNFGRKSLSELTGILDNLGLHFGMDVTPYLGEEELSGEGEEQPEGEEPVGAKKEDRTEAT